MVSGSESEPSESEAVLVMVDHSSRSEFVDLEVGVEVDWSAWFTEMPRPWTS